MSRKSRSAPAGVVVIGAGVTGTFHIQSIDEVLSALRGADATRRSLPSSKSVALPD